MNEQPPKSGIDTLLTAPTEPADDQVAALEQQIEDLKDKQSEERFVWILVTIILFDAVIFTNMQNWAGPIIIGVVELLVILVLAARCKVDVVAPLIDKVLGAYSRSRSSD